VLDHAYLRHLFLPTSLTPSLPPSLHLSFSLSLTPSPTCVSPCPASSAPSHCAPRCTGGGPSCCPPGRAPERSSQATNAAVDEGGHVGVEVKQCPHSVARMHNRVSTASPGHRLV
jgi:hypothetical protein